MWLVESSVALVDSTSINLYIDVKGCPKVPGNMLLHKRRVPLIYVMSKFESFCLCKTLIQICCGFEVMLPKEAWL